MYVRADLSVLFRRSCSGLSPLGGPLGGRSATGDTEQTRDSCLLKGLLISLALETWLSRRFHHPAWWGRGSVHLCTDTRVHTQQLLSFWESGICGHGGQCAYMTSPPIKLGPWVSIRLAHELSWFAAGEIVSYMTPKKRVLETCAFSWFYLVSFHCNKPQP